jgi:UDPglucose 6-dehydrogenase
MKIDARIWPKVFFNAGMGCAGGTLGRHIRALQHLGENGAVTTELFEAITMVNERRVPRILQQLARFKSPLAGSQICLFGLTYKPGTSTLWRSAALELIDALVDKKVLVSRRLIRSRAWMVRLQGL